jgi:hypothetical protein
MPLPESQISNSVVYLYLHLKLGLTITPALDIKKICACLPCIFVFWKQKERDLLPCRI